MDRKKKEILFEMVYRELIESIVLPRGYSKSPITIYLQCYRKAIGRTNYILEAIGEKLDFIPDFFFE